MNWDNVDKEIEAGYINVRKHPSLDLFIYNYTQHTQFERRWNEETKRCRGLITDGNRNIVSRPLPKFFNYGEVPTPAGSFLVQEKLDGQLGISYFVGKKMYIATRGSFESVGAFTANGLLEKYSSISFDPALTYMFEIIHPDTQIVVNYKGREELVFLAAIETATGQEVDVKLNMPTPLVYKYEYLDDVLNHRESNFEGFVLKFEGGERLKIKLEEYVRLHKLITGVNEKHVWLRLMYGQSHENFLAGVPDEFFTWFTATEAKLKAAYQQIYDTAATELDQALRQSDGTRRSLASLLLRSKYPSVCFLLLDNKDPAETIWKLVKPIPKK